MLLGRLLSLSAVNFDISPRAVPTTPLPPPSFPRVWGRNTVGEILSQQRSMRQIADKDDRPKDLTWPPKPQVPFPLLPQLPKRRHSSIKKLPGRGPNPFVSGNVIVSLLGADLATPGRSVFGLLLPEAGFHNVIHLKRVRHLEMRVTGGER